jgi:hypothetical protein
VPDEVRVATNCYRDEMDVLGQFIEECCVGGGSPCRVKASDLLDEYKKWSGDVSITQKAFGLVMTERGYERTTVNGRVWYVGIGFYAKESHEVEDDLDYPLPPQATEKEDDIGEKARQVEDGRPKNGINSCKISREVQIREKGLPSSTKAPDIATPDSKSVAYEGRGSIPHPLPIDATLGRQHSNPRWHDAVGESVDDELAWAIPEPSYITLAYQSCTVCGVRDGTCSHWRKWGQQARQ